MASAALAGVSLGEAMGVAIVRVAMAAMRKVVSFMFDGFRLVGFGVGAEIDVRGVDVSGGCGCIGIGGRR